MRKTLVTSVSFTLELLRKLDQYKGVERRSRTEIIRNALEDYFLKYPLFETSPGVYKPIRPISNEFEGFGNFGAPHD